MDQEITHYCESCSKPLNARANYCGRCGRKVQPQNPAPAIPPADIANPAPPSSAALQPGVSILAALPIGTQRSGLMGLHQESFVLVVTNMGILVAQQTSQVMQESIRKAKEAAERDGKGFLGQWGAVLTSNNSQRYLQMRPQAILNETAGNYFIANNQIRSVKIKQSYDSEDNTRTVTVTFDTTRGKIEFSYTQIGKKKIKQILQQTLGDLVH